MKNKCASCTYYQAGRYDSGSHGSCRRGPPTVTGNSFSSWPSVSVEDWCGQHEGIVKLRGEA